MGALVTTPDESGPLFTYDATHRTVWSGWQDLDEYRVNGENQTLISRRVYGNGLDEIVRLETIPSAGQALTAYTPFYDTTGNLVMLPMPLANP